MAIIVVFELPGVSQAQYEQVSDRLTGGRGRLRTASDWPVHGMISHAACATPTGWLVVDVWDSAAAFERFGELLAPYLREAGMPEIVPKVYPAYNVVTA